MASLSIAVSASSQAGVYLFIPNVTNGAGAGVHLDEIALTSVQYGEAVSITQGGGTPHAGVPSLSEVVVSNAFDLGSLRLQSSLLKGTKQAFVEIRFYSQTQMVYQIALDEVFVTSHSTSSDGQGCASGCQSISESLSFAAFGKAVYRNLTTNPNQVLTYNIKTNTTTFTQ